MVSLCQHPEGNSVWIIPHCSECQDASFSRLFPPWGMVGRTGICSLPAVNGPEEQVFPGLHLLRREKMWALFSHRWEGVHAEQSCNGSCSFTQQQSGTWHPVGVLLRGRRAWRFNQHPLTTCPVSAAFLRPFRWVRNESLPALSRLPMGTSSMRCNNRIPIFF